MGTNDSEIADLKDALTKFADKNSAYMMVTVVSDVLFDLAYSTRSNTSSPRTIRQLAMGIDYTLAGALPIKPTE